MGQKCNPTGLRIGVIKNWDSRWYAKKADFGNTCLLYTSPSPRDCS